MDLEAAARQSGVIPPQRVDSFISCLKSPSDYSWLLTVPHPTETRLQGDLFCDFPFAIVDHDGNPKCSRFTVLVLNNTCDLQPSRSNFVTAAPVLDFGSYSQSIVKKRGGNKAANFLKDVMANKVFEILWLPAFGAFRDGAVVLLDRIGAISIDVYESALANNRRIASFSQNGFYFFLIKITKHLARPESDEVIRDN
jgi:hypothetical protein